MSAASPEVPGTGSPSTGPGGASGLSCPECGGPLWEVRDAPDGPALGFKCRLGHRSSRENLVAGQGRAVETAIWGAVNAQEERAALLREQGLHAHRAGSPTVAGRFERQAQETDAHAETIRRTLLAVVRSLTPAPDSDAA